MNRQMRIGFILWVSFCILVIIFAIGYIIHGQLQANSHSLAQLLTAIKTPHMSFWGL